MVSKARVLNFEFMKSVYQANCTTTRIGKAAAIPIHPLAVMIRKDNVNPRLLFDYAYMSLPSPFLHCSTMAKTNLEREVDITHNPRILGFKKNHIKLGSI